MCVVCGCANPTATHPGQAHVAVDTKTGDLHYGAGAARVSVPGMSPARAIQLEADVLGANNRIAAANRAHFAGHGVRAFNLVSSPGSGKTTLLCATIAALRAREPQLPVAVIEGDQQTSLDAERIRATGAPAVQINTGKLCHLDARLVADALTQLPPLDGGVLFIENVGNLVCPAVYDLGQAANVVALSVTEGEDKPLKYPDMFAAADVMLLNKCDLLPYLEFDADLAEANARRVNPKLKLIRVSATSGEGLDEWLDWIRAGVARQQGLRQVTVDALQRRIAELEQQLAAR